MTHHHIAFVIFAIARSKDMKLNAGLKVERCQSSTASATVVLCIFEDF